MLFELDRKMLIVGITAHIRDLLEAVIFAHNERRGILHSLGDDVFFRRHIKFFIEKLSEICVAHHRFFGSLCQRKILPEHIFFYVEYRRQNFLIFRFGIFRVLVKFGKNAV